MAASTSMTFKLFGQDVSAGKTLKDVGKTAGGVAAGIGASWAASKLTDFAKQSMNAFQDLGGETMKLQRYMGGSAEDASRLAHAFTMTGTDSDTATKSLGILSKHLAANDKAAQSMGISFRDSAGNLKPMSENLPALADHFAKLPAGADRSAEAMKIFGRGGMAMLPFLSKGSEGIAALQAESDKLGTTLSGSDLDAVKANTLAKRQFGEAVKGLQVSVGRELYPTITQLTNFLSNSVVPVVRTVVQWMQQNKTVVGILAGAIIGLVVATKAISLATTAWSTITTVAGAAQSMLTLNMERNVIAQKAMVIASYAQRAALGIATAAQWLFNAAMSANPIGIVVLAIVALIAIFAALYFKVGWVRAFVDACWQGIQKAISVVVEWFKQYAWPVIQVIINFLVAYWKFLWSIVSAVWQWIWDKISGFVNWFKTTAWPIIQAVIGFIVAYYKTIWTVVSAVFTWVADKIGAFVAWFRDVVLPPIKTAAGAIGSAFSALWGVVRGVWDNISSKISSVWRTIQTVASSISKAFDGVWDGLSRGLGSIVQKFKDLWNGSVGGKHIPIPFTDGITIPPLASGGIVSRPTLVLAGENGPEAITPLHRMGSLGQGGGGSDIHVHVTGIVSGSADQVARQLATILRDGVSRGAVTAAW